MACVEEVGTIADRLEPCAGEGSGASSWQRNRRTPFSGPERIRVRLLTRAPPALHSTAETGISQAQVRPEVAACTHGHVCTVYYLLGLESFLPSSWVYFILMTRTNGTL